MPQPSRQWIRLAAATTIAGLLTWLISARPAQAQSATGTVRVAPSGTDANACGSVGAPCKTLQYAVDQFPLDATGVILIAAGTYTASSSREVVRITGRRLTMRGGYTTSFAAENPDSNIVMIDGENVRRGITVEPTPATTGTSLALSGVTITRGRAPQELGTNTLSSFGGGLDAFSATISLTHVRFAGNVAMGLASSSGVPGDGAGGGCSLRVVNGALTRVTFDDNVAQGGAGTSAAARGGLGVGGGLFAYQSNVTLADIDGSDNTARAGDAPAGLGVANGQRADALGGLWAAILSSATATGVSGRRNLAEGGDAATFGGLGLGGAVFIEKATTPVSLSAFTLQDNVARGATAGGGGSQGGLGGGGGLFSVDSVLTIDASVLTGNRALGGPGVALGGDGGGGGIYLDSVSPQPTELHATNLVIGSNTVIAGSGATKGYAFGGGVFQQCPQLSCVNPAGTPHESEFTHVTFADNVVSGANNNQGAALFVGTYATSNVRYSIVSGHKTPAIALDLGEAVLTWGATTFSTTLWYDNTTKVFVAPGGSFLDYDPRVGPPSYVASAIAAPDYHIQQTSAARNAAVGSTTLKDVDGGNRPDAGSGISDLGADEFNVPEPIGTLSLATGWAVIAAWRYTGRCRPRTRWPDPPGELHG